MPREVSTFNQHFVRSLSGDDGSATEQFYTIPLAKQSPDNYWVVKPTHFSANFDHDVPILVHALIDSPLFSGQNSVVNQSKGGSSVVPFRKSSWMIGSLALPEVSSTNVLAGVFSSHGDNRCIVKEVKAEILTVRIIDDGNFTSSAWDGETTYIFRSLSLTLNFTEMSPHH